MTAAALGRRPPVWRTGKGPPIFRPAPLRDAQRKPHDARQPDGAAQARDRDAPTTLVLNDDYCSLAVALEVSFEFSNVAYAADVIDEEQDVWVLFPIRQHIGIHLIDDP